MEMGSRGARRRSDRPCQEKAGGEEKASREEKVGGEETAGGEEGFSSEKKMIVDKSSLRKDDDCT
jgi:hypothetical protein